MRKFIFGLVLTLYIGLEASVTAQPATVFFQPLTWEQASLRAARENKLVLVEVGASNDRIEKGILRHPELLNYLQRNVIAIRIDPNTPQGQDFLPHLLRYEPPMLAFFMPYGDLLEKTSPEEVVKKPAVLREALEKAKQIATVKKSNSRSIRFEGISLEDALSQSDQTNRPVFVYFTTDASQASLLMEKNVLNLDEVADFYNSRFLPLRMNVRYAQKWIKAYEINEFPAFLYLNGEGKLLGMAFGYLSAERLIDNGNAALKKAGGLVFDTLSLEEAKARAKQEGKLIFTDFYTLGSAHNEMVRKVFADPDVNDFFTAHFVNVNKESDRAVCTFTDAEGHELHRVTGISNADVLLQEARRAIEGRGTAGLSRKYLESRRDTAFVKEYIRVLGRAGLKDQASQVAMDYLATLPPACLKEQQYWELFNRYVEVAAPEFLDFLLSFREELYTLYGEQQVRQKIAGLWIAGAGRFVKENVFDENGFKEYTRRLKKEKVEGWRNIVRNARMFAAEKTGDWKTFVTLAEEKWNEEDLSDSELYKLGVKINQECRDEGIRYKAARWFAEEAMKMEHQERISGKVKLNSYKGFFEKLADDLVGVPLINP